MKRLLLAAFLCVLLPGCVKYFFGCPNRLVGTALSPDGKFKAVTRECGCKAQSGTYLVTSIVRREDADSCSDIHKVGIAFATTTGSAGTLSMVWTDSTNLRVTPVGTHVDHVGNARIFEEYDFAPGLEPADITAEKASTPRISIGKEGAGG